MANPLITDHFQTHKKPTGPSKSSKVEKKANISTAATIISTAADLSKEEELIKLKQFDLTLEYGPCTGITRMQRWQRADKHGLNPPLEIKDLIDQHSDKEEYTLCLWKDYDL
ncbi:DNA polymerase delta subunit 4-like [Glandiceps talaboti]